MISKKYKYDDEPVVKKEVKKRVKKVEKEPKEKPEIYKLLKETREARLKNNTSLVDEIDDDEEISEVPIHETLKQDVLKGGSSLIKKPTYDNLSNFHPITHNKYDDKFVSNLRGENEELKKHIDDLKQIHRYNHSLNSINHYSHQMKIRLGNF